ncbi:MAG: DNA-processing protein DprA [Lachnospiraceae bacterium]|nr:DNA-processing protein DprA [Lachnospiraceae bacterium]
MDKYEYFWISIRNNMLPGDISYVDGKSFSYEEIMSMNEKGLIEKCHLTKKQAEYIMSTKTNKDIEREYDVFLASGAKAVTLRDDEYPERLRYIDNRPFALLYYGELPKADHSVAIIGSRSCSEYGKYMADKLSTEIALKGIDIISGMAYGIDGIAQLSALKSSGKTYGVLGCGVDLCYPRANKSLYDNLKREGGVISEYGISAPAKAENFPYRNRIISGLSDVVIVVEAKLKSGTFITVDYALSEGREIMVVPGRVTDPLSVGCNALITQGANPVQSVDDVLRVLDSVSPAFYKEKRMTTDFRCNRLKDYVPKPSEKILLEREENMVYSVLDFYSLSPEDISKALNMNIFEVMNILVSLELKGVIKETGKNLYVKCR